MTMRKLGLLAGEPAAGFSLLAAAEADSPAFDFSPAWAAPPTCPASPASARPPVSARHRVAAPAKPFFFASLAEALPRPVVLVRPFEQSPAGFEDECAFFFARLGSKKHARALPPLTERPYQEGRLPLDAVSSRMRLFYDLLYRRPALIVTNLPGLLRPFPTPEDLPRLFLRLEKDDPYERDDVLRSIESYGYVREELISFRGEYAGRGGIVDVYSPWENAPCRIEFGADGIVSIREFDPSTQKSIRKIDRILIPSLRWPAERLNSALSDSPPATSFPSSERSISLCLPLCQGIACVFIGSPKAVSRRRRTSW